ncbi:helix-turn-helix domain-containing protein [Deinococcus detaillensis]|uniref:Helix-turn-helix domain-containing protein n=1 Tax=Deinococcus detaillensis TaxID=2592048 RepID=A0A553UNB2_9DEIO|nr:helix-turn-helix domain-containing protein [Deinococcus detaillensis]TSA81441.1 helix-turn-helix domain-containing protein [Deinococcus detaillensis]
MTPARHEPHALLTIAEVAQLLHLSDDTVRRQIKEGDLPAIRLGTTPKGRARYRVAQDVVARLLAGHAQPPVPAPLLASERLQAVFAELSDEQQEALVAQAIEWARRDQLAPFSVNRSPEPSRAEIERRFASSKVLAAERNGG